MLSIHDNGHYGPGGSGAAGCVSYYELTTEKDREALACGALSAPRPGESEGIWYGFGTAPAALDGQYGTPADLRAALAGNWRGEAVRNAYAESRFMSWDLTFSAFKSASVAFAAADPQHRVQIQEAVRAAALTAFREVVIPEMYIRRGHAGRMREPVAGIAVHAYLQTQSRANDPQLHAHIIVPSYTWGNDRGVHTVEMRDVYASKLAAGAVFQAELASRLRDLGYGISRDANGVVRVSAVDPRLEELFSQRARQIEAELEKRLSPEHYEEASPGQRAFIAELTRPHHEFSWREDWASRADQAGLRQEWERAGHAYEVGHAFDRPAPDRLIIELDSLAREAAHDTIFGVERAGLTNKEWFGSAVGQLHRFTGELAARSVCTGANAEQVLRSAARALERGVLVTLESARSPGQTKITTPEMIATEQRLVDQWRGLLTRSGYQVATQHVEQAVRRWETTHNARLSLDQKAAVYAIINDRAAAVVVGAAGSGKTASLGVAREAYVTHDYARTLPRAQGVTVDHAMVVAHAESNAFCRQWGTVALTRHREDVQVHLSTAGLPHDRVRTYEPAHWPREDRQESSVDRGQYAAPELHDRSSTSELALDDKARPGALDEAAGRLAQDRPGLSTLDYQEAQQVEHFQAMGAGSALEVDISEARGPGHDAAVAGVMFERDLAIEKGGI
jgi:conjugative relaxase-like TrwC/TraI family protein